jgi:Peptidase A4 family
VTADSGVDIYKITGDITLPTVSCTDTYIGSSGFSMLYSWIGIDGYGTADVEQTGIEAYCSGTPGDLGTGTASYAAWYTICCYSGRGPATGTRSRST